MGRERVCIDQKANIMGIDGAARGGYLTVYAALSLVIIMSLFMAILEGVRRNTMNLESELITEVAMDSVFAEYHRELLEQYNLFFVDTSYGSAQPSLEKTAQHLLNYVQMNCAWEDVIPGVGLYRNFFILEGAEATIYKAATAVDKEGQVFRERAIEAIKDDVGITYLENVLGWLDTVEANDLVTMNLEQEKNQIDEEIAAYDGTSRQIDEEWVTVEVEDPTALLEAKTKGGILHLVVEDVSALSSVGVNAGNLISARKKSGKVNGGNWEIQEEKTIMDRLLFTEYAMRYCGYYGNSLDKSLLQYQIEYMIAGNDNDMDNLKSVVYQLSALREAANAIYLFSDQIKVAQAGEAAMFAASLMLLPELAPLLQSAILLGWAYAESLYDVKCLLAGKRVPLFKTAENWHYDISCVLEGILDAGNTSGETEDVGSGLNYGEYLRILLMLTSLEEQTYRLMDIVEMDIRQTPGNQYFRIDGCIDRMEAEVCIKNNFGYSIIVRSQKIYS